MATATKSSNFVISRVLDAPRDLVWKCFTDPERMKQWWGPKGFTVVHSKMDLRVGGTYHYGMKAPNGAPMWGKFVFREIVPPERLDFISTRHPGHASWPLEMHSTFTFERTAWRQNKIHRPLGCTQRDTRRAKGVRHFASEHEPGLERHPGAARSLSRKSSVAARPGGHHGAHQAKDHTVPLV